MRRGFDNRRPVHRSILVSERSRSERIEFRERARGRSAVSNDRAAGGLPDVNQGLEHI
jgi:hypothetical protein